MLVLDRKIGEQLVIDDQITVKIIRTTRRRVFVGIDAPGDCHIRRGELAAHDTEDSNADSRAQGQG